jgi:5-methylcytosine-specific restriction protein A
VARRSQTGDESSLARRSGERNAVALVARKIGSSAFAARVLADVGESISPRLALTGEELPPTNPHLAAAVEAGSVSLELSRLILATLQKVQPALSTAQLLDLERQIVHTAVTWGSGYETLVGYLKQVPNHVDPDGAKPREDAIRSRVTGWRKPLDDGLTRWQFDLDPERDAYLRAAIDACTAPRRGVLITGIDDDEPVDPRFDPATADTRPAGERLVDALLTVVRKGMAADDGRVGRSLVKVVVTMTKDSLLTALGDAHVAGVEQPISAATARRLAANAELIPQVLGGPSEILDQGAGRRFFTEAQREAMATRDHGCLWPGCTAPPSWCEAAHRLPWFGDHPTNLDNGLLLCAPITTIGMTTMAGACSGGQRRHPLVHSPAAGRRSPTVSSRRASATPPGRVISVYAPRDMRSARQQEDVRPSGPRRPGRWSWPSDSPAGMRACP